MGGTLSQKSFSADSRYSNTAYFKGTTDTVVIFSESGLGFSKSMTFDIPWQGGDGRTKGYS